ncbi:MAG: phytanoyl-CoA dioxygenase family protein [Prochloraceae cyanobacterium]
MSSIPNFQIETEQIKAFSSDGVVCLRGLFDRSWIERMQRATEKTLLSPGPLSDDIENEGRFLNDNFMWTRDSDFRAFVFSSPAAQIASSILNSSKINLLADNLLVKEPFANAPVSWHNDLPYWPIIGTKFCSIWLALDFVNIDSGGLKYIKGSHQWGQNLLAQSDPDSLLAKQNHHFLSWDLNPGDCLVHHMSTIHSSSPNNSARRRRGLVTVWAGDDVRYRYSPETWFLQSIDKLNIPETKSVFNLKNQEPIDCDLFPQILP